MARTGLDAYNIAARTASAPAIIRGSVDLSTYPGVATGVLADSTARTANGVALTAGIAWADALGKYLELPPGRYEYIATTVQDSVNCGLQVTKGVPGFVGAGAGSKGTRLIQYGTNHPALTIGDVSAADVDGTAWGIYGGFAVGFGASQTAQASAAGILFGRIHSSRLFDIAVDRYISGGDYHPYIGAVFSPTAGKTFFFSNSFEGLFNVNGGQVSLIKYQANGTGSNFHSLYLGGGSAGNRVALSGSAVDIPGRYNLEIGVMDQLNIEWVSPASGRLIANTGKLLVDTFHAEGTQANGFGGDFLNNDSGFFDIRSATFLNCWLASANASGTPTVVKHYGDAMTTIGALRMIWDGGTEQVASLGFAIYGEDTSLVGRNPTFRVGRMDLGGAGLTAAVSLDPTHTGAAPGSAGHIGSHRGYDYHPRRSRTEGAVVTMGNADMTIYGQHSNVLVKQVGDLTANRTATLSDKRAASGAGSASVRPAGDIARFKREGAGAFNLIINNQSGSALATFTGAGSAGTELAFEWSGSAWSAL